MRGTGRVPPGIQLLRRLRDGRGIPEHSRLKAYKSMVLILTFVAYACYHASRKPPSIVKSILDPSPPPSKRAAPDFASGATNYTTVTPAGEMPQYGALSVGCYYPRYPWPRGAVFVRDHGGVVERGSGGVGGSSSPSSPRTGTGDGGGKGWAPFNGPGGTAKLGEIDLAFLAVYAMGMYVAGHLADRLDLRLFLTLGMVCSGVFVGLFGMGYFWRLHLFGYYLMMQMLAGLFQATGWPSVVAIVGNWFGQRKRGLIMGVWNAHTSVGNICGSLLAASVLDSGWGWSFLLPGGLMVAAGLLVYLFLAPYPEDIGLPSPHRLQKLAGGQQGKDEEAGGHNTGARAASVNQRASSERKGSPVTLKEAFLIPGVIPFALCLFFSKLVAYTFLYWLPFYLSQTTIGGEHMSVKSAGNLSTLFDVGGIVGGIFAGYISDQLNARATTAACFMYLAIPSLYVYRRYGGISQNTNILLMMLAGLFVNGPYALITTAVSADLGTHSSLRGDSTALATVTAIIDGTGSIGAALGPLLTGFISSSGWNMVFVMLMMGAFVAGALLSMLVRTEIQQMIQRRRKPAANDSRQRETEGSPTKPLLRHEN